MNGYDWKQNYNQPTNDLFGYSGMVGDLQRVTPQGSDAATTFGQSQPFKFADMYSPQAAGGGASPWSFSNIMDKTLGSKYATPALGLLQAGLGFYQGGKQLGLAEDQLATSKEQFNRQFDIQKQNINRDIREQGKARYERNPELNPVTEDYFKKNRIL